MNAPRRPSARPTAVGLLLVALSLLVGCQNDIERSYGRRAPLVDESVNGTSVLAGMFKARGHKVAAWPWLSPKIEKRADCIVWFPDDFAPPSQEVLNWLANWLYAQPSRTLIYVGRDYDASIAYWEQVLPQVPPRLAGEARRRLAEVRAEFQIRRGMITAPVTTDWFSYDPALRKRSVRTLEGDPGWQQGIEPEQLDIELRGRMLPGDYTETLLSSEGDLLIGREWFDESQLYIVANGSFLLNLPLVNHQHRQLAGRLIDEVGAPCQVFFLESGPGGPSIHDRDPSTRSFALEMFTSPPFDFLFLHLATLGIIFACMRFPIFGLPRQGEAPRLSDFGKHIEALGELLEKARATPYAKSRLAHYAQLLRRDGAARSDARDRARPAPPADLSLPSASTTSSTE